MNSRKSTGLLIIPSRLIARNLLYTNFLQHTNDQGIQWIVISVDPEDGEYLKKNKLGQWRRFFHPMRENPKRTTLGKFADRLRYLLGLTLHMQLVYRFNLLSEFRGFRIKLKQSWNLRKQYLREGQPMSAMFGFPLPRSSIVFNFLYRLYYLNWQTYKAVDDVFKECRPDFVVIAQLQLHAITPYVLESQKRNLPIFGINGSWDQPTTKGPLFPGVRFVFCQNEQVREDLAKYHGIAMTQTKAVGWPQMDVYSGPLAKVLPRDKFLTQLGLVATNKVILFALNTPRLGGHEPVIAEELHQSLISNKFGSDAVLLLRCHPLDTDWKNRWEKFQDMPRVVVDYPNWQSFDDLVTTIAHAELVISSAGSFYLDALAMDREAIGLGWEDEAIPYFDRPARSYDMEHLQPMSQLGGVLVKNNDELTTAIKGVLQKSKNSKRKNPLRESIFYCLDGKSSERLASALVREVYNTLQRKDV